MRVAQHKLGNQEPNVKGEVLDNNGRYGDLLGWYSLMATRDDAIQYLCEFLAAHPDAVRDGVASMKRVPKQHVNLTAAWIARLIMRGATVPDSSMFFLQKKIHEMFLRKAVEPEEKTEPRASVQDHMKKKAGEVAAELEGMIDDGDYNFSVYLSREGISSAVAQLSLDILLPRCDELRDAKDGRLTEGYEDFPRGELVALVNVYSKLIEALEKHIGVSKKPRAPRKRKPISAEKLLKHLIICKKYDEYGLVSIHPERILGASELWTFNTKTNVLSVFRALDRGGLSVKRTSIHKYDEKQSVAKRIGRKTEDRLKAVLEGGKVALRKLMDDIKGDGMPVSRINKDTILLRVS